MSDIYLSVYIGKYNLLIYLHSDEQPDVSHEREGEREGVTRGPLQ